MKLSCCAYSYRDLLSAGEMSMEEFLDVCAGLGFDGVELTRYYFPQEGRAYLNHLKRECLRRGLAVSGAAVGGNFSNADPDAREKQIAHVQDWLEKAAMLGAPTLRVFAGGRPEGASEADAVGWIQDGLARCAEAAARCGVVLALETHGGLTADADGTLALLAPFADEPWVGLNLDFGNLSGGIYAEYEKLAPHAVAAHAKVTAGRGEQRRRVDYRRVVRIMRRAGYAGYLAIEYEEPDDPVEGVDRFAAYLRGCLRDG